MHNNTLTSSPNPFSNTSIYAAFPPNTTLPEDGFDCVNKPKYKCKDKVYIAGDKCSLCYVSESEIRYFFVFMFHACLQVDEIDEMKIYE